VEVTGIDASPHMLDICRSRTAKETPDVQRRIQLVEADMRSFGLGRLFRLATIPFRPFQHLLTVEDQLSCLHTIRHHLVEDGLLIFDIFNPSLELLVNAPLCEEFGAEPEFTTEDGRRVIRRGQIVAHDRFTQVTRHELMTCRANFGPPEA
jgi:hypothetical protein